MKLTSSQLLKLIREELKWNAPYPDFVNDLKVNVNEYKTKALLALGHSDGEGGNNLDTFEFGSATPSVTELTPMQKEIDIDKSLGWPIVKTEGKGLAKNVSAGGPVKLGSPIVIFNGKYIVDGHHRWSQLYACNRNASIVAVNITNSHIDPLDALKAVQASIAHQTGAVPVQTVDSVNLIGIDEGTLRGWLKKNVTSAVVKKCFPVVDKFKSLAGIDPDYGRRILGQNVRKDEENVEEAANLHGKIIIDAIVKNVESMNATSDPIDGAPSRSDMPQTDGVNWTGPLKTGQIDVAEPHAAAQDQKESLNNNDKLIVERWQILAGIVKG